MKTVAKNESIDWISRLGESFVRIEKILPKKRCVCLPDFFVDILLFMAMPVSDFIKAFKANLSGEGRNIYASGGKIVPGGNAFNTARAVAKLGCVTTFIGETDEFGSSIANKVAYEIPGLKVQLRTSDRINSTTAIEIQDENGISHNIQLSLAEALRNWGPEELNAQDETEIRQADLVYLSNWGINPHGNSLLERVLELATGCVMFDPGNIFAGEQRINCLLELLQKVDIVSLSFDEYRFLEQQANLRYSNASLKSLLENALIFIHGHTKVEIIQQDNQIEVPTFEINPVIQTGLGDSFAAGVAAGLLSDLPAPEAALLGSAVAGHYGICLTHPSLKDIELFLNREIVRSLVSSIAGRESD